MSKQVYVVKYGCCAEAVFSTPEAAEHYRKLLVVPNDKYSDPPRVEPMDLDPRIPVLNMYAFGFVISMTRDGKHYGVSSESLLAAFNARWQVTFIQGTENFTDPGDETMRFDTMIAQIIADTEQAALARTDQYRKKLIAAGCWPVVLEQDVEMQDYANILRDEPEIA